MKAIRKTSNPPSVMAKQSKSDGCNSCDTKPKQKPAYVIDYIDTVIGKIPRVSSSLTKADKIGAIKTRLNINRMNYKVEPGLYAIGDPTPYSQVLVTSNYKLTFDAVRKELADLDLWILVLDTFGINVWCAAGKGTFGTEELIKKIVRTNLMEVISHRNLILPQLGAPGISAHMVTKLTGFKVMYGPVLAKDYRKYAKNGYKATPEMRLVKFNMWDRLVLAPVEMSMLIKPSIYIFAVLFLLNLVLPQPIGLPEVLTYFGAIVTGCFITPMLLPYIPGRAFAWKGWLTGLIMVILVQYIVDLSILQKIGFFLIFPSLSAFCAMNFTGTSTYTSLSGVVKEMKFAVPFMLISVVLGSLSLLINSII